MCRIVLESAAGFGSLSITRCSGKGDVGVMGLQSSLIGRPVLPPIIITSCKRRGSLAGVHADLGVEDLLGVGISRTTSEAIAPDAWPVPDRLLQQKQFAPAGERHGHSTP